MVTINYVQVAIWKQSVVACFRELSWYGLDDTDENQENYHAR
jgi:hypothetical protein